MGCSCSGSCTIGSVILCSVSSSLFVVFGVLCITEQRTGVTRGGGDGVSDGFLAGGNINFSGIGNGEYSFLSALVRTCPLLP